MAKAKKVKDIGSIDIIIDTREQKPWTFENATDSIVVNTYREKLDTGDYTVRGLEPILTIERKASVGELVGNISESRFKNELDRLLSYKYRYLFLEFDFQDVFRWDDVSQYLTLSNSQRKITSKFIMRYMSDIQTKYDIPIVFCTNWFYAQRYGLNIMRRISEKERRT